MARFWIVERGQIIFISFVKTEDKNESEVKLELHKAIIQALKDNGEK